MSKPGCWRIGRCVQTVLTPDLTVFLKNYDSREPQSVYKFWRLQLHRNLFYSKEYTRVKSRNSYTVHLLVGDTFEYGHIKYFLEVRFANDSTALHFAAVVLLRWP